MKIKELIATLKTMPQNAEFQVANDEELNTIFSKLQIGDIGNNRFVIYGLTGSEIE